MEQEPKSVSFETDDDLIAGLETDGRINLELTIAPEPFEKIVNMVDEGQKKQIEILKEKGMRPEDVYTKVSQLDSLAWNTELGPSELTIQAANTFEGLNDAPKVNAHAESFKMQRRVRGVFWPAEEHALFVLAMPEGGLLRMNLFSEDFPKDAWRRVVVALVQRNHRLKAPIFWHPCPECGKYFKPKRRGQLFDTRKCADKAGQRRRYKSRIQSS